MELSARGDAEPSLDLGKAMLQQRLLRVRARSSGAFARYICTRFKEEIIVFFEHRVSTLTIFLFRFLFFKEGMIAFLDSGGLLFGGSGVTFEGLGVHFEHQG